MRISDWSSDVCSSDQALQRAAGRAATGGVEAGGATPDFGSAISSALQQVNTQQAKASALSEAYERGDTHDIVSVMIERQKASLGFETTLQVRNKLLSAYRSEEHTSELQSLMRISYAVFCLQKHNNK